MISPFFGLSVIIHVGVIIWHKSVSFFFPNRKKRRIIKPHIVTHFFGLLSIFAVLTFVVFTGITIMYASILEKHSSLYVLKEAVPYIAHFDYSSAYTETISAIPTTQSLIQSFSSLNAYSILFVVSVMSLLLILLQGESVAKAVTYLQKQLPLRRFFVGMGTFVLIVGAASFIFYILPVDSVAAYFTEPKFARIFGK